MKWLDSLINKLLGVDKMAEAFEREFPGRCLVCSFHRYGYGQGYTSEPMPPAHVCTEGQHGSPAEI